MDVNDSGDKADKKAYNEVNITDLNGSSRSSDLNPEEQFPDTIKWSISWRSNVPKNLRAYKAVLLMNGNIPQNKCELLYATAW